MNQVRGTEHHTLSFATLRKANLARCIQFRDSKGNLCHPNGIDNWTASQWTNACFGEFGEALECLMKLGGIANMIKKIERGDKTMEEKRQEIAHEIADVQTYLDLLAAKLGIDLGAATAEKFNIVSRRVSADVFIAGNEIVFNLYKKDGS
jgi:NTP pyrophosphatase (non-canonical NTP hydrolase)